MQTLHTVTIEKLVFGGPADAFAALQLWRAGKVSV